jgi:hypothetical protein
MTNIRRLLMILILLPCAAGAQYSRGYLFLAPTVDTTHSGNSASYGVGGGAERMLERGIGVGIGLSAIIPGRGKAANTVGNLSFNAYYHFRPKENLDPFVTGGYSLLFRDFTANGFNFGAGLNYWYSENHAFALELREVAANKDPAFPEHHFLEIRIGWTFR